MNVSATTGQWRVKGLPSFDGMIQKGHIRRPLIWFAIRQNRSVLQPPPAWSAPAQFMAAVVFVNPPQCVSTSQASQMFGTLFSSYPHCRMPLNILNVSPTLNHFENVQGAILSFPHQRCALTQLEGMSPRAYTATDLSFPQPHSSPLVSLVSLLYLQPNNIAECPATAVYY